MFHRTIILATALVVAASSKAAMAAQKQVGGMGVAEVAAGDARTSAGSEFQARHAERFRSADTDGNDLIDSGELEAAILRHMAERKIEALDRNGDGGIDGEGFNAIWTKRVATRDHRAAGELRPDGKHRHGGGHRNDAPHRHDGHHHEHHRH